MRRGDSEGVAGRGSWMRRGDSEGVVGRGLCMRTSALGCTHLDRKLASWGAPTPVADDPETYLHRVGRTGRYGRKGVALNLIDGNPQLKVMKQIEQYFHRAGVPLTVKWNVVCERFQSHEAK